MCDYCSSVPHLSRCPLSCDDGDIYENKCASCGSFFPSASGAVFRDEAYCDSCMESFSVDELLEVTGCATVREIIEYILGGEGNYQG